MACKNGERALSEENIHKLADPVNSPMSVILDLSIIKQTTDKPLKNSPAALKRNWP